VAFRSASPPELVVWHEVPRSAERAVAPQAGCVHPV